MKKIQRKIIDFIFVVVFYSAIVLLAIGMIRPSTFSFWPSYELLFVLMIAYFAYTRFSISAVPLTFFGVFLLILSVIFDYLKKDVPALFYSNIALIMFILGGIDVFVSGLKKSVGVEKKILFVANAIVGDNPGVSGGESRFIEIGKEWQKMGYEIHLFSSKGGKTLCENMGMQVILHELTSSPRDSRFEFFRRLFLITLYLPILLKDFNSGIVYSTSEQIYDVLPGSMLKIFNPRAIKHAVAVHWLPPILFWKRSGSRWFNSLFFMLSERFGLILGIFTADALLPVSKSTLNDMKNAHLINKFTYEVKCGVNLSDIKQISEKYPEKEYDSVFMKRIQSVKGIFDLIDIWGLVVKQRKNASLIIIGSGIDEQKAKEYVSEKKLNSNIKFLGVIYDFEDKFKYLSKSKLFLLPSLEENWAIVIGEAMATSLPVICYYLKELKEVWKNSVTFIDFRNKEQFAKKVISLLDSEKEYKRISEEGLKFIQQYDWKIIAKEEINFIYNKV